MPLEKLFRIVPEQEQEPLLTWNDALKFFLLSLPFILFYCGLIGILVAAGPEMGAVFEEILATFGTVATLF